MKYQLFTYEAADGPRPGLVVSNRWYDLAKLSLLANAGALVGNDVDSMLGRWDEASVALDGLATQVSSEQSEFAGAELNADGLTLLPPVTRPGAIYGAGANYRDHVEAMGRALNQRLILDPKKEGVPPWHFLKSGRATLSGHKGKVRFPMRTEKLDWEAELAVVIGRTASHVPVEQALEHVAGYMCANDLSARDYLVRAKIDASSPFRFDWIGHKSFNGSCPLGPVFTPAQFVGSPENLDIKLWLNGELRQDSNTRNHLYGVAEQIAHISQRVDLLPGDIILTGTPAGVGMESGTFLKSGDVIKVWIEGLGELETQIV
ncbi:fumarylacetoacetate hydrolase family protein [Variovorax paradoxus]|nr:fumarylacetoacetate hydrolase family protein [Variovorax paradoxus]MBT2304060.1 fumarylacetoacetate hydrolase family protein [Variovorax paradoxus]